jgi:DNA-binding MarR family transcriptional regulator
MNEMKMDPCYSLWLLLSETKSALFKAREKKIGHYVHANQASVLVYIWFRDGQATISEMSKTVSREIHTVSELISRMEKKGLVIKTRDPKRKNVTHLAVTEKGRDMAQEVIQIDFVRKMISTLSAEQQRQLSSILNTLLKAAQNELGIEGQPQR